MAPRDLHLLLHALRDLFSHPVWGLVFAAYDRRGVLFLRGDYKRLVLPTLAFVSINICIHSFREKPDLQLRMLRQTTESHAARI